MKILLAYSKPTRQLVDIKIQLSLSKSTLLQLASWRPGRYEIANYAQYLYPFKITKGTGTIHKINKDCWKLDGTGEFEISYQFHAARMDAGSSWLDEEQLYINFINCIPKVIGHEDEPIEIVLDLPKKYTIASALKKAHHTLYASNYSELVDNPFFASETLKTFHYIVSNTTFFIHIQGQWNPDEKSLIDDFRKFTKTQLDFFGGTFPNPEYHFLIQALPYKHYHGVEHQNATVITLGPDIDISKPELYKELLGISSHELFHAWNVTRIRPKEMVPYDFSKEAYHITGFITEGLTTYFGDLMLYRSGVFSTEEYLQEVNTLLKRHFQNDGRTTTSLTESSMDLWLDGYKLGSPFRKVSIYNEGALCALLLDLKIITESDGKFSLQHVMNDLWIKFGDTQNGYTLDDYRQIINTYTDGDNYLNTYIFGTTSLETELQDLLKKVDYELVLENSNDELEHFYGIKTMVKEEKREIVLLAKNSEAEELLMIGDIIEKQENTLFSISRKGVKKNIELPNKKAYFGYYQITALPSKQHLKWV